MRALLRVDVSVIHDSDAESNSLLHLAAKAGHPMALSILIDRGINIDEVNIDHNTPLYSASKRGHLECCKIFLDKKANVNFSCSVS